MNEKNLVQYRELSGTEYQDYMTEYYNYIDKQKKPFYDKYPILSMFIFCCLAYGLFYLGVVVVVKISRRG